MHEIPEPETIVALVQGLAQQAWPKSGAESGALFARMGWRHERQFPASRKHGPADEFVLDTGVGSPPVFATSTETDGVLDSIYLQLRLGEALPDPDATDCFQAIITRLTEIYGEPSIPWHGQRGLRRMWNVNGMDIDVHFGNDSHSSLMIGFLDEQFFAEVEAYAREHG